MRLMTSGLGIFSRGEVAVWNFRENSLEVENAGPDFLSPNASIISRGSTRLDAHPWLMAFLIVSVLAAFAATIALVLHRREREEIERGKG